MNHFTVKVSLLLTVLVGCSQYKPQSTVVKQEKLAEYNPKNFAHKSSSMHPKVEEEDRWIMKALWNEEQHDFVQSNAYYVKLYDTTHKEEYLFKELTTALFAGIRSKNIPKLESYTMVHPNDVRAKRLLLSFYLGEKKYEQAKKIATALMAQSNKAIDFELAANPYIYTKDYTNAISLLTKAYKKTLNEAILIKIITIKINYMNDLEGGIQDLEAHRRKRGCSEKICLQLVDIYTQQRKADKLLPLYKSLYKVTGKEVYAGKLIDFYVYAKSYDKAIEFLKTEYSNDELLYAILLQKKDYKKANSLSRKLLKRTQKPKWYAESAMALFESASNKNDRAMLNEVVSLFEKALEGGIQQSIYLNYYGYTLVDKNIDVAKGIKIIKMALKNEPENSYYLDSLAWGYYKLGNCKKAYSLMQKVVAIEGLEEKEIIEHWSAIKQQCKH